MLRDLDQGQSVTLTFGTPKDSLYSFSWLHLPTFKSQTTRFWKLHCFNFFPYKGIMDQIWSCHKIGQGQLRVIIWTNLVVFEYPMLLTNFQGHRHIGSREEECFMFLPYMAGPFEQTFVPPFHWDIKFGFNRPSGFSGKEVWKCWIWVTLDQGQWMTLTFDFHIGSCTHLVNCIYQPWHHRLQQFLKYSLFYLFPIQKHKGSNLPLP